ncbi:MAG: tetratricopeptide repeat-containing diguanylate cyclase [Caldilineaceae bacterium]
MPTRNEYTMLSDSLLLLTAQARRCRSTSPEQSLQMAAQAEETARAAGHNAALIEALLCSSHCLLLMEQEMEKARTQLTEALGLCRLLAKPAYYGETLYLRGLLFLLSYALEDAEIDLVQSVEWLDKANLREWNVVALSALGRVYIEMGSYPTALKVLRDALSLGEDIGFEKMGQIFYISGHQYRADIFRYIGVVYSNMDQFARAISYYEIALETYEQIAPSHAGRTLYNMGIAANEMGNVDLALSYYQRSYDLECEWGTASGAAISLGGIGEVFIGLGQLDQAWAALQKAEKCLSTDEINRGFYADLLWTMGDCLLRQGKSSEALIYYLRTMSLLEETDRASSQFAIHHQKLATLYKSLGDFEKALHHFECFHQLTTEHLEESWTEQMHQAMVQFDTERALKDREILHLHSQELEKEIAERTAIQVALAKAKDELEARNRELALLSQKDQLTGLYNRRFLDGIIEPLLSVARKMHEPVSVALCDIDDFKQINDLLSHAVGDEVLRIVADILQTSLRRTDVAVRYGGEEFMAIFPNTEEGEAALLMDQFRGTVAGHRWSQITESLGVTISIGVATQTRHTDSYTLIRDADVCLYSAKRRGKNQVITSSQLQVGDVPPDMLNATILPRLNRE